MQRSILSRALSSLLASSSSSSSVSSKAATSFLPAPFSSPSSPTQLLFTRGAKTWGDPNWSKARHGPHARRSLRQSGQNLRTQQEQFEFIEKHCRKPFPEAEPKPGVIPVAQYKNGQWVRYWRVARMNIRFRSAMVNGAPSTQPGGGRVYLRALSEGRFKGMAPKSTRTRRWRREMQRFIFREANHFVVKWNGKINKLLAEELALKKEQDLKGWLTEWQKKKGPTGIKLNLPKEALTRLGIESAT